MRVSTPHEVGLLVRERRQDLRLSQAELAARVRVSREWLVAVEKGHARAELGKLLSLLAELGLTLDLSTDQHSQAAREGDPDLFPGVDLDELLGEHDERTRRPR